MGRGHIVVQVCIALAVVGCDEPASTVDDPRLTLVRATADPEINPPGADAGATDAGATDAGATPQFECGMTQEEMLWWGDLAIKTDLHESLEVFLLLSVYRGTASAMDNASVIPGHQDGKLTGKVIATVGDYRGFATLAVIGTESPTWFTVSDFSTDYASAVHTFGVPSTSAGTGTVDGSVSFFPPGQTIAFTYSATGTWDPEGLPFNVQGEVALEALPAGDLTLEDVAALWNPQPDSLNKTPFVQVSETRAERVFHQVFAPISCEPEAGYTIGECKLDIEWSALEFVNPSNLSEHGYEDLQIGDVSHCCRHCDEYPVGGCVPGVSGYKAICFE